jgi:hypothetical protein
MEFGSTSALSGGVRVIIGIIGCVRSDFVTGQLVASQADRHTL